MILEILVILSFLWHPGFLCIRVGQGIRPCLEVRDYPYLLLDQEFHLILHFQVLPECQGFHLFQGSRERLCFLDLQIDQGVLVFRLYLGIRQLLVFRR